ncbi:hypothetical protein V1477_011674 [Vespula maculifrons]|uniref:Uncharacterized protein n=1 Tax=Vespula maculifrons TaxID=7453 RepID=A0ABD2BZY8_VESMC
MLPGKKELMTGNYSLKRQYYCYFFVALYMLHLHLIYKQKQAICIPLKITCIIFFCIYASIIYKKEQRKLVVKMTTFFDVVHIVLTMLYKMFYKYLLLFVIDIIYISNLYAK